MTSTALSLLRHVSWPQWRHQPLRTLTAVLAIVLGVALAFSVQLINQSALAEFGAAVRSVNGQPDFELRAQASGFDEALYARVAAHPQVAVASPVIEIDTQAQAASGERVAVKLLGVDALSAAPVAPALMPRVNDGADRLALLSAEAVFLNGAAQQRLGNPATLSLRTPDGWVVPRVQGRVAAGGPPLVVMDIAAVQARFGWLGRLSRIDVRLQAGADRAAVLRALALPEGVRAASPDESAERASNMSRAYRVNLTVLALVALFTGAFLVFSILSLSVAQRQPQLALLGVLGLSAGERLRLVLLEALLLGVAGSVMGLLLGSGLAALALRMLAGDLGGGYFPGVAPRLQFSAGAAALYGALGVLAAGVGAWVPARAAQRMAPAQALKGLGSAHGGAGIAWFGPVMLVAALVLALLPPVAELPLPAYASVACLLLGGIACVPAGVQLLMRLLPPPRHALALLAVERARHERHSATIAVAGVVASLSLAVALTVMVTSFRDSMVDWLDQVLPADLYLRVPAGDVAGLPLALVAQAPGLPGVRRATTQRAATVQLAPERPPVALLARDIADPAQALPFVGPLLPLPEGATAAYVSEGMARLYQLQAGQRTMLPLPNGQRAEVFVRGVWRDYAHQHGAVVLHASDYRRLTGDLRVTDLALVLQPGTDVAALQQTLRTLAGADAPVLQFATAGELRAVSLRIFDRSFAVTYWLQAVAIGIGLFGIAASFSAQVLARRKEFGLLAHLGFTRRQVLAVVAGEGAVWTSAGALLGLLLGLAVSVVLVKVVNPQSFHWTMEMALPVMRLALLCAAVVVAGTLTAWLAARNAASRQMALAVKEDW
ncbi:ABC transporter permease [Rhizobacter sp. J219]|uniref:ABC transporter permease n=1 Tax=Rhizobacter sp. J219 TaxID=2898430 RepID=UPI0021515B3B|nr:ABC transporter permease [Rhizobacter sp. J219]MCR5882856.1 ABC transporter permease [Rhizobacter sp. J219]